MSGCCNESGCTRKKPMMLMRSDLTGTWYIVTAYTERGDGVFRASTKHRLPDNMQDQLEDMRDGHAAAARADRLLEEPAMEAGREVPLEWVSARDLRAALAAEPSP